MQVYELVAEGDLRSSSLQFVPGAVVRGLISAWQSFYTQYVIVTISRNINVFRNNSHDNGILALYYLDVSIISYTVSGNCSLAMCTVFRKFYDCL